MDRSRPSGPLSDALTFGWRTVLTFRHVPEQLFDRVMTPVLVTRLFTFVLGGALAGSPGEYLQIFLPGILAQAVIFSPVHSGVGLCADLQKGLVDRLRPLRIWSLAPFARLMVGDVLRHLIAGGIILGIGLALGYRPKGGGPRRRRRVPPLVMSLGVGWAFLVIGLLATSR